MQIMPLSDAIADAQTFINVVFSIEGERDGYRRMRGAWALERAGIDGRTARSLLQTADPICLQAAISRARAAAHAAFSACPGLRG